jgi:hypothetical protein
MANSINQCFKNKKRGNIRDELYTPISLVNILIPYLYYWCDKKRINPIIWSPFDTEDSEFCYAWREYNFKYICSHINTGQDFFEYEPSVFDLVISNPPFSRKLDVYKRLNQFGKPWAMIGNIMQLNYMEIGNYFADNTVQLLIPDKRISFDGNSSSFCSGYICKDFLPRDLIFVHMKNCNSGKDFYPSRMLKKFPMTPYPLV